MSRVKDKVYDIWYVPLLADNQVERYEMIRNSYYKDAINGIINMLRKS